MKPHVSLVIPVVIIATMIFPLVALAQEDDPASIMEGFSITTAGDPQAGIEYLDESVIISITPPPPGQSGTWTGLQEAQGFLEFTSMQNVQRELVGSWQVDGNNVSGTVMVTADQLVAWSVAPVEHILEATVENGKITSWTSTMTPPEQERVAAARDAAQEPGMPAAGAGGAGKPGNLWLMVAVASFLLAAGAVAQRVHARLV